MNIRNNRGAALPIVMIMFVVIMIFGTVTMKIYMAEAKTAIYQKHKTEAYYVSRSASDAIGNYLVSESAEIEAGSFAERVINLPVGDSIRTDSAHVNQLLDGTVEIEIHRRSNHEYEIFAYGRVGDVSNKASLVLSTAGGIDDLTFDHVLVSDTEMDLNGMDVINGDVAVDEDGTYTEPKKGTINGDVTEDADFNFPEPSVPSEYDGVILYGNDRNVWDLISKGEVIAANLNLFNNKDEKYMAFGEINYKNETITLDMSGGDRTIFVHDIYLQGGDPIILNGDGTLIIFVENYAEIKQFPKKNDGTPAPASQFLVMLLSGATADLTANADVNGFFYGPSATITMKTGNAVFSGAMICDTFIGGNGNINYVEPPLDFSLSSNVVSGFKYYRWE